MEATISRQGDFQLRLAQWLLDQLGSPGELETVTQQFSFLISQAQGQSIENLYANIGKLIFQKVAQIQLEGPRIGIRLCAELCYSLFVFHVKQRSSLSLRIMLIHEHLFRLCIDSISAESATKLSSEWNRNETTIGFSAVLPCNGDGISVERNSQLLFYLCDFRLISLAQICEYMLRVVESCKNSIGTRLSDAVAGMRLLNRLFPDDSPVPWKNEADLFSGWVDVRLNLNGNQTDTSVGGTNRSKEPHSMLETEDKAIKPGMLNLDLSSEGDAGDLSSGSLDGSVSFSKMGSSSQSQVHEEEELDDATGNNFGKPPHTPVTPRAKSPVGTHSQEGQVLTGVATSTEFPPPSSVGCGIDSVETAPKDMDKGIPRDTTTTEVIAGPLFPTTAPLDPSPFDSTPGFNYCPPTQSTQSRPPSTPSVPSSASPPPLRPTTTTALQNPTCAPSPPSSNNALAFSPDDLSCSTNPVRNNTDDRDLPSYKPVTSMGIEVQENRRVATEQGEKGKEAKEERERRERMMAETKKRDKEAERRAREEVERKAEERRIAREEAERKAEERRAKYEEAKRREEELRAMQKAEREAREQAERKAKEDLRAREEAERVVEEERRAKEETARRKEEELRLKEVTHKAREEERRKAREQLERRLAERKAKREAERKAKEEEERKAREEELKEGERKTKEETERKAKAEAERKAKEEEERKAQEERERKGAERRAKRDAERKAKREADFNAREEEHKAREEEERKVREERERREEWRNLLRIIHREAELEAEEREAREAAEVAARAEAEEREAEEAADRAKAEAIAQEEEAKEKAEREREKWIRHLEYLEGFTTPTGRAQGKRKNQRW